MWILTSLGRPRRIRNLVNSYAAWGSGESDVYLTLYAKDARLDEYLAQKWPDNWHIEIVGCEGNGPTYNEMLSRFPHEPFYGFMADDQLFPDARILTELEREAGRWNVSYPNDGRWGQHLCTMPCIGGELVRAVGYLAPPGFMHWAIDNAWYAIGASLGSLRYRDDIKYTHAHPLNGLAENDATYEKARLASVGWSEMLRAFVLGGGLAGAVQRTEQRRMVLGGT